MTDLATMDPDLRSSRSCTRCDGVQQLVAAALGMGSYSCGTCGMRVGFEPVEFLLDRGQPARYTRDVFGDQLLVDERRLPS